MTREYDSSQTNYRGNLNEATCAIGNGNKKWTGMYKDVGYALWQYSGSGSGNPFYPEYWTGIDCSGLVFRSMQAAKTELGSLVSVKGAWDGSNILQITDDDAGKWLSVTNIFYINRSNNIKDTERIYYFDRTLDENLHRGDLVQYGRRHVSTVYSDGPYSCDENKDNCVYKIIHAYGGDRFGQYTFPDILQASELRGQTVFARKAIITFKNISSSPTGFGRIKIWN